MWLLLQTLCSMKNELFQLIFTYTEPQLKSLNFTLLMPKSAYHFYVRSSR